jgi:hypothetical protein
MRFGSRKTIATALATASIALAAAAPAAASQAIEVSGDLVPTSTTLAPREVGENLVLEGVGTHAWSGGLIGTSSIAVELVVHPSGVSTFRAVVTFTGNTPCGPATLSFVTTGSGELPLLAGHATTTGPDDVRAELDVSLVLLPEGAYVHYTGDVHCG